MTQRTILWMIAAAMGIFASAAVAWAASQLAGQRIGLSSAPPSVVRGLAPPSPSSEMHSLHVLRTPRPPTSRGLSHPRADDSSKIGGFSRPPADDSGESRDRGSAGPDD